MRMIFEKHVFLARLAQRIDIALTFYLAPENDHLGADVVYDAIAMAGYELMSLDPGYWHPLEDEVAVLIEEIKTACLEYEFSGMLDEAADERLYKAAKNALIKLAKYADDLSQKPRTAWLVKAPITELLQGRKPLEQSKTNTERAARSRKLKKHIMVLQVRTDNALSDLCDALTDLLGGGGQ
ncbi:MAG: hypothetical protein IJ210_15140 [Clostridia bacterium]|nr:hypothetical protein [Clostridia bacterium]